MLEDDYRYVVRKAMVGCGLGSDDVAERTGLNSEQWMRFIGGEFSAETARACARVLGLKEEALARHPEYHPDPLEVTGVMRIELPFGGETVNAWWLSDGETGLVFDLGFQMQDFIEALPGNPDAVFITHAHRDHVGALDHAVKAGIPVYSASDLPGAVRIAAGQAWRHGSLAIRSCDVSGHCEPQLGYFVDGLERPLLVLGDALFAGSMGKCASPALYRHALGRLHDVLDPLPDDVLLLPGHGPATTLGEERESNPFL